MEAPSLRRPTEFFQQGQIVDPEGAVDAAHHHHIDEAQAEDDVAVEELGAHEGIGVVECWSIGVLGLRHQAITPSLHYSNENLFYFASAALMSLILTSKFKVLPASG